ncbi:MAG: MarR family transcriptional regulator [Patescibacteria group bacterium]|jgi:DNA-binding MarR family transcriptional regulator|nr:MarR family transcriptional regulator [Patescibacteria group bacterium]
MQVLEENSLLRQFGMTAARIQAYANRLYFEPVGLTTSCAIILHLLNHHGSMTPTEILKHMGGTKSNISQRLRTLERDNLIERNENDSEDKRQIMVSLTERGLQRHNAFNNLISSTTKQLESELEFTKEEHLACQRVIEKINNFLDLHANELCKRICPFKGSK